MKCIAAVVMMALAVAVEGSAVSYWGYGAPLAYAAPHTTVVQDNSYAQLVAPWNYGSGYLAAPLAYSSVAAYPYSVQPAVVAVAQKEARYLAANRGAVHDAPLPGHAISQQSLNLEPAPGTL